MMVATFVKGQMNLNYRVTGVTVYLTQGLAPEAP
jgi:hypothetical protein